MNDLAKLAASLTKAQRTMVIASEPDDISGREGAGIEIRGADYRVARHLEDIGLGRHTHGSPYYDMYWNTPLGLALRVHLKEENDAEG